MPKTKVTRKRICVSIDAELHDKLKENNIRVSTIINNHLNALFSSSLKKTKEEDSDKNTHF